MSEAMSQWLIETRRHIHKNPELSGEEFETQAFIIQNLEALGIPYEKVADTGVVATIKGDETLPCIGIRADIDALPIVERVESDFKSQKEGVMHACGHDAHTTILMGVGKYIVEHAPQWGTVKLFFQPAEETFGGADRMVQAGVMTQPKVDGVIGLHVMPYMPVGQIETKRGKLNAASDQVECVIRGKSSHGAYPEKGLDAMTIAAEAILGLQTIITRQMSPLDQAVLSIGKIHGGVKNNVICEEVTFSGILRTTSEETRVQLKAKMSQYISYLCQAYGAKGQIEFHKGYNALINDDAIADLIMKVGSEVLGEENVLVKEFPSLGVEDFSYFLEAAEGAFYHIGCGKGTREALHTSGFELDEEVLSLGVKLQVAILDRLMKRPKSAYQQK